MQLLRVGPAGAERPAGRTADGRLVDLSSVTADFDRSFFADGGVTRAAEAIESGSLAQFDPEELRTGPPIARPGKIVCIGLNYRDHAAETNTDPLAEPAVFMKAANTVVGPDDEVLIPLGSRKTDWEVELAVVIGRTARYLESPRAARDVIAGYAISNDVSEREFQLERGGQWDKGKSCETFNPFGPVLVTADEVPDPQDLRLRLWVNGQLRQDANTKNMIFPVHYVLWCLSQFMVLEPGDVVNTGTPAGVAMGLPRAEQLCPAR